MSKTTAVPRHAPLGAARLLLVLLVSTGVALALAPPALAARGHEYGYSFGENVNKTAITEGRSASERNVCPAPGHPADVCQNGESGSGPGQLNNPAGLAVNETSDVLYVADRGNKRIDRFDPKTGAFLGSFDGGATFEPEPGVTQPTTEAGHGGGPDEEPSGKFVEPIESLAVDNTCYRHSPRLTGAACEAFDPSNGDVYVVENGKGGHRLVDKFSSTGAYVGQITEKTIGASSPNFLFFAVTVNQLGEVLATALDGGTFGENHIERFTNEVANKLIESRIIYVATSFSSPPYFIAGLALGPGEDFYAANTIRGGSGVSEFTFGEDPYFFGSAKIGLVLVEEFSHPVPETAPPTLGLAVEPSTEDVYVDNGTEWVRYSSADKQLEALSVPGYGAGLAVGPVVNGGDTVYVADDVANDIRVFLPEGPSRPTVQPGSESITDVTASSVSFSAEINPRSEQGEAATSYRFEYGPCETAATCSSSPYTQSSPVPAGVLAASYEPDVITTHPQDLTAHTVYHMRVVANNSYGESVGEELVFTTQGTGAPMLPDGREWELVSSPDKFGATIEAIGGSGVIQAAANGDAISYVANAPTEAEPSGFAQLVQILSRRGVSSWQSQDIATPHETMTGYNLSTESEYDFFSEDLSRAVVRPFGPFTQLTSPQASEQTPYLRNDFSAEDPSQPCTSSCYRPLVSGCPVAGEPCPAPVRDAADVPEGTKIDGSNNEVPTFLGASPDASHIVLSARAPLTEGAPEEGYAGSDSLYEWTGGKLSLVSMLPDNISAAPITRPELGFVGEGISTKIFRHAISSDGSRVVWSADELGTTKLHLTGNRHLYLRDSVTEQTVQLDKPEVACVVKGGCKSTAYPIFQTASADDSRIFFTDNQPLTARSGTSDLYECLVEEVGGELSTCELSDLTIPGVAEAGPGALGLVAGASEDGLAVYFTSNDKLSSEPDAQGEVAVAGDCSGNSGSGVNEFVAAAEQCNLYERVDGQTRLVAVLSGADFPDWAMTRAGLTGLTDSVSPNGRYLAFMSRRSLTGYDSRDAVSDRPDEEVFLYDSAANDGHGRLVCASCNPTGGRPRGVPYKQIGGEGGIAGGPNVWPVSAGIAANVPGWVSFNYANDFVAHQPRYLSDSGRLFFNSADALQPQDTNGTEDVYEYEPPSVGDCTTEAVTYALASGGCVDLISSGTGKGESAFLDASETGNDVFFLTSQRLRPEPDLDSSVDVYDAHVCSTSSPCLPAPPPPPPACEGDSCQSPLAAPDDPTPGSLTFQGPGNPILPPPATAVKTKSVGLSRAQELKRALKACKAEKNSRRRQTCETQAHKKYRSAGKATKSTQRGRRK